MAPVSAIDLSLAPLHGCRTTSFPGHSGIRNGAIAARNTVDSRGIVPAQTVTGPDEILVPVSLQMPVPDFATSSEKEPVELPVRIVVGLSLSPAGLVK
jgi:hypothetical protein